MTRQQSDSLDSALSCWNCWNGIFRSQGILNSSRVGWSYSLGDDPPGPMTSSCGAMLGDGCPMIPWLDRGHGPQPSEAQAMIIGETPTRCWPSPSFDDLRSASTVPGPVDQLPEPPSSYAGISWHVGKQVLDIHIVTHKLSVQHVKRGWIPNNYGPDSSVNLCRLIFTSREC